MRQPFAITRFAWGWRPVSVVAAIAACCVGFTKPTNAAERPMTVAIMGDLEGAAGVYQLPSGSTLEAAIQLVNGRPAPALLRYRVWRRAMIESSAPRFELMNGDVVYLIPTKQRQKTTRTIALVSAAGRPIVFELPVENSNREWLSDQLATLLPQPTPLVVRPVSAQTQRSFDDGMILALDNVTRDSWERLTARFKIVPSSGIRRDVSQRAAPLLPARIPRQDLSQGFEPGQATPPIAADIAVQPTLPKIIPGRVTPIEPPEIKRILQPTAVDARRTVERVPPEEVGVASGVISAVASSVEQAEIRTIAGPEILAEPRIAPTPATARELAAEPAANVVTPRGLTIAGIAVAIVLVLTGGYVFFQQPEPVVSREADDSDERATPIEDLSILREEADVMLPLSVAGRAVALGRLRIDQAHEQVSGPHFRVRDDLPVAQGAIGLSHQSSRRGSPIPKSDVLGRALAAMEQERGR